jgi:hypothetical protein
VEALRNPTQPTTKTNKFSTTILNPEKPGFLSVVTTHEFVFKLILQMKHVIIDNIFSVSLLMENPNSIWIITDDTPQILPPENTKSGNNRGGNWGDETRTPDIQKALEKKGLENAVQVDADKLEQEMSRFLLVLDKIFTSAEQQTQQKPVSKSGIQLDEIELAV